MILWALYSATLAIKNGKYTVPFFEYFMGYIVIHSMIWATYKTHNLAFHGFYILHKFVR